MDRGLFIDSLGSGRQEERKRKQTAKLVRKGWHKDVAEILPIKPTVCGFGEWGVISAWQRLYKFLEKVNALPEEQRWEIVAALGGYDDEE